MAAKRVHLNGGPWHDREVAVGDDWDRFSIRGLMPLTFNEEQDIAAVEAAVLQGSYSAVRGYPGEFEWDGWKQ